MTTKYEEQTELTCTSCGEGFPSQDIVWSWFEEQYCSVGCMEFDLENGRM